MTPHRRSSIVAGTLILLATVATLTSTALAPARTGPGYLTGIATHSGAMATSLLLTLIAAGCSVGIAIALYAVLHRTDPTLAVGAIAFRGIEAVFYIVGAVSLMTLVSLATSPPSDTVGSDRPGKPSPMHWSLLITGPASLPSAPSSSEPRCTTLRCTEPGSSPAGSPGRASPRCRSWPPPAAWRSTATTP